MGRTTTMIFQDREQAGRLLSKRLKAYERSNTIVVGIPHGGVSVAAEIADELNLPLEVIPCRKMRHPADSGRYLGSVSVNDIYLHDYTHGIPQDYIYHQIALLKGSVLYQQNYYYHNEGPRPFTDKKIILVDDLLQTGDSVMACLRSIRNEKPEKIIVAVPVVSAEASRVVRSEADELVYLKLDPVIVNGSDYYVDYNKVTDVKVKELLEKSRKPLELFE